MLSTVDVTSWESIAFTCFVLFLFWIWRPRKPTTDVVKSPTGWREHASLQKSSSRTDNGTNAEAESQSSSCWWFCCAGIERKEGTDSAALLASSDTMMVHPKFCGLRLQRPGEQLPDCSSFSADLGLGPERCFSFNQLGCTDIETDGCIQLKAQLVAVSGPKDPITLIRYLRARQGNVTRAAQMYGQSMKWRDENKFAGGFQDGTIDDSLHRRFDPYWKPVAVLGRDRDGDCVAWERLGRGHMPSAAATPVEFLVKHEVYTNVRVQQALDEQARFDGRPLMYYTVVEDLYGLGLQHMNWAGLQKYKACVRISEDYFPEIVKRIIIVRAPWIFTKIWAIVQHFFDAGTRDKIQIVNPSDTYKVLTKYIDKEWIPESLGGDLRVASDPDCAPLIPLAGPVPPDILNEICALYS